MKQTKILTINGIQCFQENGKTYLKLESVAYELGLTITAANGEKAVDWPTVYYLAENIGIRTDNLYKTFIPESVFYRLLIFVGETPISLAGAKKIQAVIASLSKKTGTKPLEPRPFVAEKRQVQDRDVLKPFLTFTHPTFGRLRLIAFDGEWWFIGRDVIAAFGLKGAATTILHAVHWENISEMILQLSNGSYENTLLINSDGILDLVHSNPSPRTNEFVAWLSQKVLSAVGEICKKAPREQDRRNKEEHKQQKKETSLQNELTEARKQLARREARIRQLEAENRQFTQFFSDILGG